MNIHSKKLLTGSLLSLLVLPTIHANDPVIHKPVLVLDIPSTKTELINRARSYCNNKVLDATEEQIEKFITGLMNDVSISSLNKEDILKDLVTIVNNLITYHQNNIDNKWDTQALSIGSIGFGITAILAYLHYCAYATWHKPIKDEIAEFYKRYNITERVEFSHGGKRMTKYISGAGKKTDKLVDLMQTDDFLNGIEFIGAAFWIFPGAASLGFLHIGLFVDPQHKKFYEQLCIFKKYLDKEINKYKQIQ